MLRKISLLFVTTITAFGIFAQSGTLKGTVKDPTTGEAIPFANVTIEKGGSIITGGMTDFDGKYTIKPIPSGSYTVKASYVGYSTKEIAGVKINSDKITFLNFDLTSGVQIQEVEVYAAPLIDPDQVSTGGSVSAEEIKKMPGRSAEAVATTVAGVYSQDGNISSVRGAREGATVYYVDGVKVRGTSSVPKSAMADVSVITGGIPAKYGDATGGIISIQTSGPSKELSGGFEVLTSQYLDPYRKSLAEFNISGPLLYKTEIDRYDTTRMVKNPIAGFFLSGNFSYDRDYAPRAGGVDVATDDVLQDLIDNPIRRDPNINSLGIQYNSLWLTDDAFENIKYNKDLPRYRSQASGRFDYKPSQYINITLGGSIDYINSRAYAYENQMFNSINNGQEINNTWRVYLRLTQRFPDKSSEEEGSSQLIKNAFYRIQVDYSSDKRTRQDVNHKDNLFNYGYIGKFTTYKIPAYEWVDTISGYPNGVYQLNGYLDTLYDFEAGDLNPVLAGYTEAYYNMYDADDFAGYYTNRSLAESYGAILNGSTPRSVYGLYNSPGTPYNTYDQRDRSQFRISASGSADIKDHEISFGFEFEQRSDRGYDVNNAVGLWTLADQWTNYHLTELNNTDSSTFIYHFDDNGVFQDTITYIRLYAEENQSLFDIKLRESLGLDVDGLEWLDIGTYDPSQLNIEFFSPDELFSDGSEYVTYYGYDHAGNKLKGKPSFSEFFTEVDEYGEYTRLIAPYEPSYAALYIQDKFGFNDLVFNIGLRIDRYDANQMVPKDAYVPTHETYKAGDSQTTDLLNQSGNTLPQGIGDDYVVYVNDVNNPSQVYGYRDGDSWYNSNGAPIDNYMNIASTTGISPYLVDADAPVSESSFEDYQPQITAMPRISFSFPISDVALFFAHYDVLSTRPTANSWVNGGTRNLSRMDPTDYLYIQSDASYLANPNLRPEKTIDYELGFQQKLSDNSSMTISAFYREMRDMVQVISIQGAYPINYTTFGNMDFGTVKGFSVSYALRRSGNATIRANYTLQFANGTGSDPSTADNLIREGYGNIRFTNPFDYDQRHSIQLAVDFRFGGKVSGRAYNGPNWFGRDILENTGANFTVQAGSGRPYSKKDINNDNLIGSINGSRMPWSKTINMRIDRDFLISIGKDEDKKKHIYMNIYLDILNLLNTANIFGVHDNTGNPDDDGYLTAAIKQPEIEAQMSEESYRNYYSMFIDYPWNYSRPRTIQLGLLFSF